MDRNFQDYYQDNLQYLRKQGADFAREFPKIAARLGISSTDCQDPYVERILEGAAFLAARVEKKHDDGVPRLLESLFASMAPKALVPISSCCIQEIQNLNPSALAADRTLKEGTKFLCSVPGVATKCTFSTIWNTDLYDAKINQFKYLTLDIGNYGLAAESGILFDIVFSPDDTKNNAGNMTLFINLDHEQASTLQMQLMEDLDKVYVKAGDRYVECGDIGFSIPPFHSNLNSIAENARLRPSGIFYIQQFLTFQSVFKFFKITNFKKLLQYTDSGHLQFIVTLKRRHDDFVHLLKSDSIKLNCVSAINAFIKRSDRSVVDVRHEFQVVADRTAPLDYEIVHIRSIDLFDANNRLLVTMRNLYENPETFSGDTDREYFSVHRRSRLIQQGHVQRSSYRGSEVFVSFSGDIQRTHQVENMQFAADLICSNRDLPLLLRSDAVLSANEPILAKNAIFAVPPSRPEPPQISNGSMESWEKVGFLTIHFSSIFWQPGTIPLKMMQEMLRLFLINHSETAQSYISGIVELTTEPHIFRFIRRGCFFFENGWKVKLVLDETHFAGIGYYIFSYVLRFIIKGYTPLNTPLILELFTKQQGKIAEWTM